MGKNLIIGHIFKSLVLGWKRFEPFIKGIHSAIFFDAIIRNRYLGIIFRKN